MRVGSVIINGSHDRRARAANYFYTNPSTEQNCCIINTLPRSTTTTACMHEEEESEPLQHEKKTSLMTLQVKK